MFQLTLLIGHVRYKKQPELQFDQKSIYFRRTVWRSRKTLWTKRLFGERRLVRAKESEPIALITTNVAGE
jgi:hypothetical protein